MANPPTISKMPLEDPLHEREIFATEVTGIGNIHGNLTLTLASVRFDEPVGNEAPKVRRVVTARLILTNAAAVQLFQSLQKFVAQIEAAAAAPEK